MTRDYDINHPWRCWLGGHHVGRRSTRKAAMNLLDRPWRAGKGEVRNEATGEQWLRPRGVWFKNSDGHKRTPAPASLERVAAQPVGTSGTHSLTRGVARPDAMEVPAGKSVAPPARQGELTLAPVSSQTAGGRHE